MIYLHLFNVKIGLYADDTILYSTIHTLSDCITLQKDLDSLTQWATKWKMSFNSDKSEHMKITHKHNPVLFNYTLKNQPIKEVPLAKCLGITITNKLTWSTHINSITNKAFLQRNLRSCTSHTKLQCYTTMIKPMLEYANTVWSSYTKKDIAKIERVKRQSAHFIMADYSHHSSVTIMLTNLKLPSLEHRRTISSLILFYKIIHNLINIPSSDLIPITPCTRGHHQRFQHIYARISLYSNSFFPRTMRIWNSLPEDTIRQQSLSQFKSTLKSSHYY